jgi:N-methylhydantoinase A/oxoprolinase/acetone carboxylase beta subunit
VAARSLLVEPRMRVDAPVYRFDDLAAEQAIAGAAIVEYRGSTLFLPSGWHARLDTRGNARLVREPVAPGSSQQAARKEMA